MKKLQTNRWASLPLRYAICSGDSVPLSLLLATGCDVPIFSFLLKPKISDRILLHLGICSLNDLRSRVRTPKILFSWTFRFQQIMFNGGTVLLLWFRYFILCVCTWSTVFTQIFFLFVSKAPLLLLSFSSLFFYHISNFSHISLHPPPSTNHQSR